MQRRWGRGPWLAAWCVIAAAQVGAVAQLATDDVRLVAALAVLQLLKVPICLPRLNDLGRPSDDAMGAVIPFLNVVLWVQLFARAPKEEVRARRIAAWSTQLTTFGAYREATRALIGTAWPAVPATLAVGTATAALVEWSGARVLAAMEGPSRASWLEVATWVVGALTVYVVAQVARRHKVTRGSWAVALAWLPAVLVAIALKTQPFAGAGLGILIAHLPLMAADLLLWPIAAGLLVPMWVRAARPLLDPTPVDPDAPTGTAAEVMVVWGGRFQAVAVGAQLFVIPGIYLSIVWAFADLLATLQPGRAAFERSARLARGVYSKLFKMLTLWFLATLALDLVVMSPWADLWSIVQTVGGMPGLVGPEARVAASVARFVVTWWSTLAMLAVFLERDRLMVSHEAKLAAASA